MIAARDGAFGHQLACRWAIAAALLPRLIASCGAGVAVVCGQSEGGSQWLSAPAANWCKGGCGERCDGPMPRWADDRQRNSMSRGCRSPLQRIYGAARWQVRLNEVGMSGG